ncbi:MAG: hypothetical protein ABIJ56_14395 [Pseudomonadota bacterium]
MKVVDFLKKAAAKTGIVKVTKERREDDSVEVTVETRSISLEELVARRREESEAQYEKTAAELTVDFDDIFVAGGIETPQHGWSAEKALEMVESEDLGALGPGRIARLLLDRLDEENIPAEDIVKDAAARDQALDSYERYAYKKLQERSKERRQEITKLSQRIDELAKQAKSLESAQRKDEEFFDAWLERKKSMEERLLRVVSLITPDHGVEAGSVVKEDND